MTLPAEKATTTEAAALAEIVEWSKASPPWQRDALRRLCQKGELDEAGLDELTSICKGDKHKAVPIEKSHVKDPAAASATVVLKGVHDVQHVNALAEGEQLTFDKIGVTVIYGDNGSGKSGYARILKKACRARVATNETVHQNIYATKSGVPTAVVDFTVNGSHRSETWVLGKVPDSLLSAVSVFDSRAANVHVDQTNDLAYTPLPLKLLASLVQASLTIRDRLAKDIKRLKEQTPAALSKPSCQSGTKVGQLIAQLGAATKASEVEELAVLTPEDVERLASLKADLAADPEKGGRQLQAVKARLDAGISRVGKLIAAASDEHIADLRTKYRAYTAARAAAQAASSALFSDEPLPNIGSDAWRALWQSARGYSEEAYAGKPFPVTGDGARCVLCLQHLDHNASERLGRFERFVKDESKRLETLAKDEYEAALQTVQAAMSRAERLAFIAVIRDEIGNPDMAKKVRAGIATALWRSRVALRNHQAAAMSPLPVVAEFPHTALQLASDDLQTRSTALQGNADSVDRKKLVAARDELADREWLAGLKADVLAEIDRREQIMWLDLASKDTATNRITTKSNDLADKLVTNALRAQFAIEVDRMGVAGLAIELRKEKSAPGVPLFRVALIKKPTAKVGDVLSEGEHRCVALAAFLAELATGDSQSTIVFDDPVSSLDHMHREAVAGRLAAEGAKRQIVVLTHDIAFLFLLTELCREQGTHITYRSINRGSENAGFCQANPPPNAQPVDKVVEALQKQLDNQKIHYARGNQVEWYRTVRSLQEQLRTAWERCVEDALSPVIRRLANKVDTKGLSKLTVLTLDDCRVMREAFGRCSSLLHSASEALNPPLPKPEVIEQEIVALRDWMTDIRARQGKVKEVA